MRKILLLAGALYCLNIQGQEIVRETWIAAPGLHTIPAAHLKESAVIIMDKRRVEYADEKEGLNIYKTSHRIVHINDDKGIESFNRIYLPISDNAELVDIKARTILKSGKIIEIDRSHIKDLKEDDQVYKIFAMEGLEPGCEVEYLYTYKMNGGFFGTEVLQGKTPVLHATLEVVAPSRLIFEIKPYNTTTVPTDTIAGLKRWVTCNEKDIPGAEEEKYAAYLANLRRFEYKLAFNTERNGKDRLLSWDELAKRVLKTYTDFTDKEIKKVNDLVGDLKLKNLATDYDKVVAIENHIKTNFANREDIDGDDASNLEKIVKTRLAGQRGIVRLYAAMFKELAIPHEFVLVPNRTRYSIDKKFENWNNCEFTVIYFPGLKKFMAPTLSEYRLPWIEPNWGNTNAFFCRTTTIGNFTTGYAEIRKIPLEDHTQSHNNILAEINLNKSLDTLMMDVTQSFTGYSASVYKSMFTFSDEESKREIKKEIIKFNTKSENVVSSSFENTDFNTYHQNKPFVVNAKVKSTELLEKAGNKTILKIGEIIGPQSEMYQDKPRIFPIEVNYPHVLNRKITLTIPDGYIIKNAKDLEIKQVYQENGEMTMGFTSTYEQTGNRLTVTVSEEYRRTNYPLSQFEDFKKVINAAADFNKVALVLEKKPG